MCTVTYIPTSNGFVLTSSRDELVARATRAPTDYQHGVNHLTYPKDEKAGGTWIATDRQGRIACLLNGAFDGHIKKPPYRKSRGLVLLESFDHKDLLEFWSLTDLTDIEPFTLLLLDEGQTLKFLECRWDGERKHTREVDTSEPSIWSSATLYDHDMQQQRKCWFEKWTEDHSHLEDRNIINFHTTRHGTDPQRDVLMQRNNGLQTVSVTQIARVGSSERIIYEDISDRLRTDLIFSHGKEAEHE